MMFPPKKGTTAILTFQEVRKCRCRSEYEIPFSYSKLTERRDVSLACGCGCGAIAHRREKEDDGKDGSVTFGLGPKGLYIKVNL